MSDVVSYGARDLYLRVLINDEPTGFVEAFHQDADGVLTADPELLRGVGILPADAARDPAGRIVLDRLPNVTYVFDDPTQTIAFTATDATRIARRIDTQGGRRPEDAAAETAVAAQSGYGALVNYSLFASTPSGEMSRVFDFGGASGSFEGRMFSPYGVLSQTFVASTTSDGPYTSRRLDTNWAYSDPGSLRSYQVGDLVTGGLAWTRPTRLGGVQVRRNFTLRSDLVTMPLPEISGSAAVPSTVDVYLNGARRFSKQVGSGPFELTNLPAVTGAGVARVVVRDAQGQETVSETSFFASSKLLSPGLLDYSAELGFGRKSFGLNDDGYDERLMGSASLRYGITDWLTAEAHAEGGEAVANGGAGVLMPLGSVGVLSFAAAGSRSEAGTGFQLNASAELKLGKASLYGRSQRSFGDYQDIAAIIDASQEDDSLDLFLPHRTGPPKALDQVSLSLPLGFDPATVNLSFTHLESADDVSKSVVGLSVSRPVFGRNTLYASAFKGIGTDQLGFRVGLTVPIGQDMSSSVGASGSVDRTIVTASVSKRGKNDFGDYTWRVRDSEGDIANRAASADYRTRFAEFGVDVGQSGEQFRASGGVDGAVVVAGGDVFFSQPITDAFAVVDVGAPDIAVEYENRPAGRTNGRGRLLLPQLRAFEKNRITIDPTDLPLDVALNSTSATVVPADRVGVVVAFEGATAPAAALVTFRTASGEYLPLGAEGRKADGSAAFVIGYDGQAYIEGLADRNAITIELPLGGTCNAEFGYAGQGGSQVAIPDVVCGQPAG
ncbi:MAG: fimbrial biogenesis outer membrane usher protein [Rhizobiaceae bacterium]|nr:fimbrial biogenesis outer membrane usher protein [Rhizobiaceae bacterium]